MIMILIVVCNRYFGNARRYPETQTGKSGSRFMKLFISASESCCA
jgi:hypothetical protein